MTGGFTHIDAWIVHALQHEQIPARIVVTSTRLASMIAEELLYDRVRLHGWRGDFRPAFMAAHPELFPECLAVDGAAREITVAAMRAMQAEARRCGVSHYRDIPIVVDDAQSGFRLDCRPWGDPPA